jgi:hypothetical protein
MTSYVFYALMMIFLFQHFQYHTHTHTHFQISVQKYKLLEIVQSLCNISKSALDSKVLQSNVETGICLFPLIHLACKHSSMNKWKYQQLNAIICDLFISLHVSHKSCKNLFLCISCSLQFRQWCSLLIFLNSL